MAAATAQGTYINPMAALASQIPHAALNGINGMNGINGINGLNGIHGIANSVVPPTSGTGNGPQVNGTLPSLPSPTMPTFNMAAQTPNGQGGAEVYTNGIPQTYPGRKY